MTWTADTREGRLLEGSALSKPTLRVVQYATGNVGSEMVGRIVEHPDLELVGLYCYSPEKVGRDVGDIVGIAPLGVAATNDIADVLRVKPDVVNFNGVWPDIDTFCTLLENGINVVTTSDWITGYHRDRNHPHPSGKKPTELIEAACRRGKATFYGTGMNPGLAQILSVVATAGMGRVDHITVLETVDVSCHHSVDTWKNVGYGRPVDDPEVPGLLETGCAVFADSIYMMADCFDLEIDDIAFDCELGACTEDVDLEMCIRDRHLVAAVTEQRRSRRDGQRGLPAGRRIRDRDLGNGRQQAQDALPDLRVACPPGQRDSGGSPEGVVDVVLQGLAGGHLQRGLNPLLAHESLPRRCALLPYLLPCGRACLLYTSHCR